MVELYARTFATLSAHAFKLDLAHLLWSQSKATVLSRALPQFVRCNFLDVSRNPFGAHGVVMLTGGIAKMPELRTLIMKCCRGLAVAASVPKWSSNLSRMRTLELLNVSDNAFDDSSLPTLAKCFRFNFRIDSSARNLKNGGFTAADLRNVGFTAGRAEERRIHCCTAETRRVHCRRPEERRIFCCTAEARRVYCESAEESRFLAECYRGRRFGWIKMFFHDSWFQGFLVPDEHDF